MLVSVISSVSRRGSNPEEASDPNGLIGLIYLGGLSLASGR